MAFTPRAITIPGRTVQVGVNTFGPLAVPSGASEADFRVDRTQFLDPASSVNGVLEVSQDSGSTWQAQGTFGDHGGIPGTDPGDPPIADFYMLGLNLGDPTNVNRRVKLTLTVTGGPFVTSGGSVALR
jgi:hypothetical protein